MLNSFKCKRDTKAGVGVRNQELNRIMLIKCGMHEISNHHHRHHHWAAKLKLLANSG